MSSRAITEFQAKTIVYNNIDQCPLKILPIAHFDLRQSWDSFENVNHWIDQETRLVVKVDQLIKRRGKLGLLEKDVTYLSAKKWIKSKSEKEIQIGKIHGYVTNFVIEPYISHKQEDECYVCIYSVRSGDVVLFYHRGGIDVGDVDQKSENLFVPLEKTPSYVEIVSKLLINLKCNVKKQLVAEFIIKLHQLYVNLHFTYLEINPLLVNGDDKTIYMLDIAAKLDSAADFMCRRQWGEIEFPTPFGRQLLPEEQYVAELDSRSGASLKLTKVEFGQWSLVVVLRDTICDMGEASELANYGEYSGAPTEVQTYEYAKTILKLMTSTKVHKSGKVLIIGGSIANFTNVADTFKGIILALEEYRLELIRHKVSIYVRRGGPNFQEGLRLMKEAGKTLEIPVHVYGTDTHMTAVVGMAMGKVSHCCKNSQPVATASFLLNTSQSTASLSMDSEQASSGPVDQVQFDLDKSGEANRELFTSNTRAIVWGMQVKAVQSMLDFDYVCQRKLPSVVAMTYPMTGDHKQKFYFGHKEILIPVYKSMAKAIEKHPDASVLINFASLRSAYDATVEALQFPQVRCIAIIAEGIPENFTRKLITRAEQAGVTIIGPATVGGIKPGCFKIGNTGGMMDNIMASKLYRPGSVAYVSRSGGMSNELNNIISQVTNGVYEGVAIGGDRYPCSTFCDHLLRFEDDPKVKMMVMLGEIGGVEEYKVCELLKNGKIKKPLVAWCIGTCASFLPSEVYGYMNCLNKCRQCKNRDVKVGVGLSLDVLSVQFGHSGASAAAEKETACSKNRALKDAGAHVPNTFDDLATCIKKIYEELVQDGKIQLLDEKPPPAVPMDYSWARELGLIRKPSSFMSSICDERGNELLYAGVPISKIISEGLGLGGVLSLLWFRRRLPDYAFKFIEMCLIVTADHGPAVSGAHNTIVCARAGKDLVSSLVSGLLTIGERFGGALDMAAKQFSRAYDEGLNPMEFVHKMRKEGQLIMGIGHRVKSINNPDARVKILHDYVVEHFPEHPLVDYAKQVEQITTKKKPNLILNVDGIIGVAFVDLLRKSGCFTEQEAQEYIDIGTLNGLFVLGRSIGFIGHYLDQKRLKQGLYRHPWDDITYLMPEDSTNL
ncbi:ATP-citrate synthase [Trichinella patagoniensis]|uniref:ATP-citrate synthase n=2 Tax=Trichinella patagoniensis TaxID=990121 RepID=A0A0V1A979_9BILA|nr:ATP-citrate synthase [Trichinella patagoniensis]